MIEKIIRDRMEFTGLTQAKLAASIGCTAPQLNLFLNGTGFMNKAYLEKCLSTLGLDLDIYQRRQDCAKKAALKLRELDIELIKRMPKKKMAELTKMEEITTLIDVDEDQFEKIINFGLVDFESTYPFFKSLVLQYLNSGDKSTPKQVEKSLDQLMSSSNSKSPVFLGVGGMVGVMTLAMMELVMKPVYKSICKTAIMPYVTLAKSLLRLKDSKHTT